MQSSILAPLERIGGHACEWPRASAGLDPMPISCFTEGQNIYSSGERAALAFRVEYGAVRVSRVLASGRRQILSFHFGGNWFGLQTEDCRRFTAQAIGSTRLRSVDLQKNPGMWPELLPAVLENCVSAEEHQLVVSRQSAVERVAGFLIEMSTRLGRTNIFVLSMPRIDVADYLGLTIETVSRCLTKLKNKRLIRLHGARGIEIIDQGRLRDLCL